VQKAETLKTEIPLLAGFTEHYMIDIDVGTGECLRLANSSGKGYDRLSN